MFIGEALAGDGNEIAHIDLLIGSKDGPVGVAFANALARQSEGHTNLLAVLTPNLAVKPATVMITKVTIKGMRQAVQMFGPAQAAVAKAVADSVADGVIKKSDAENLVCVCGVFIHPQAADDKKIYDYNYEATKMAIKNAMEGKPTRRRNDRRQGQGGSSVPRVLIVVMKKILLQLDSDPQPSVFDSVVAIDSGVDFLLRHGGVTPAMVRNLVHGAMFTRGGEELKNTAIFISGSDVVAGEHICCRPCVNRSSARSACRSCSTPTARTPPPPRQWSVPVGICRWGRERSLLVLGATGPVGQRVVRMLAREGVRCARRLAQEDSRRSGVPSDRRGRAGAR